MSTCTRCYYEIYYAENMAIERLFSKMRQDVLNNASEITEESARLLREGDISEAEKRMSQVGTEVDKAKRVDDAVKAMLEVLRVAGISQPPADYLEQIAREPEKAAPSEFTPVRPSPDEAVSKTQDKRGLSRIFSGLFSSKSQDQGAIFTQIPVQEKDQIVIPETEPQDPKLRQIQREDVTGVEEASQQDQQTSPAEAETQPPQVTTASRPGRISRRRGAGRESQITTEVDLPTLTLVSHERVVIEDGNMTKLGRSEWKLMEYLAQTPNKEVKLDDITTSLYGGSTSVGQRKLVGTVLRLRQKLGETGRNPRLVQHREGSYILSARVEIADENHQNQEEIQSQTASEQVTATEPPKIENLQLTEPELHLLAQKLLQATPETLSISGVRISAGDRTEIGEIMGRLASQPEILRASTISADTLRLKLIEYVKAKEKVFMENINNEDAQYLITFLAQVDSEEKLTEFLNS